MSRLPASSENVSRRQILQCASTMAVGLWAAGSARADESANLLSTRVISRQPHLYAGWPTLARRSNGELVLVWSGGREAHVCPFGRVDWMRSTDEGKTWTWPRTLLDSAIDDRDAGIVETAQGSLLVTTFTSSAWEPILDRAEKEDSSAWPDERLERWRAVRRRLPNEARNAELGTWMIRSNDGGLSWSSRYRVPVDSPHGPIQLADGRLLYAGVALWEEPRRVGVAQSTDDGITWGWLAEIPTRDGDDSKNYHELHAVEANDGRLVAQIRNHNTTNKHETLQTHSDDGGRTWATPYSIGVWGYPSHLLKLRDGRMLMSYGHRRQPVGNLARLSDDAGRTWSEPLTISDDATSTDLGYPSTVQLSDGSLLTVWYERMEGSANAVLRQAHWRLED